MGKQRNTSEANVPPSNASLADLYSTSNGEIDNSGQPTPTDVSLDDLRRHEPEDQQLVNSLTPDFEKQADRATQDELIGGFNFNYEYMGGENYMSDDLKEIQAQRMPGSDKLKRGLGRFAGEFVLNVLETPGILGGAAAALVTGDINKMTDNFWVNAAEGMKEALHEHAPVYSSKHVREGGVWDKMSSGEWLATEGASALAFMTSALVPGLAISKGAKAMGLVRMLSKGGPRTQKALAAVDKAAAKLGLADDAVLPTLGQASGDMGSLVTTTLANTVFESGIEAMGAQKSFKDQLQRKYTSGEISYEEYAEHLQHADAAAVAVFKRNMALLAGPNMLMSKMMLGPTANTMAKAHKNIRLSDAGKWVKGGIEEATTKVGKLAQKGPVQAVGKMGKGFVKNTFREGVVEEMGQMSIEKYFTDEYIDALASGEDKRNWARTYANVMGSTDGQIAALTGGIISGPMSMRQRYMEGKAIRKQTDELVNNYNGVTNYYTAVRDDIYETDENGDIVQEMRDEDGNVVTEGGTMHPKVDQTKLADIADAKEEVDRLRAIQEKFIADGEISKAKAIGARLQAGSFGVHLSQGKEGLEALRDMMMQSPATKAAVDLHNQEEGDDLTVQGFVDEQMATATEMQKDLHKYNTNILRPLTSSWEKENAVIEKTEEGKLVSGWRTKFGQNWGQNFMESRNVVRELEKQQSDIAKSIKDSEDLEVHEDLIAVLKEEQVTIEKGLDAALKQNKKFSNPKELERQWNKFFKARMGAQRINDGQVVYDLNEVIANAKNAKTTKELGEVVADALERGLIIPEVSKDKLPDNLVALLTSESPDDIMRGLAILSPHTDITQEAKEKYATKVETIRTRDHIDNLPEVEEERAAAQAAAEAARNEPDPDKFQGDEQEDGGEVTYPGEDDVTAEPTIREQLSQIEVRRIDKPESDDATFRWLTTDTPLNEYYNKLAELVQAVKDGTHTNDTIDQLFIALKLDPQLGDTILKLAPGFNKAASIRGTKASNDAWAEYLDTKTFTDQDVQDAAIEDIDTGYESDKGISRELAKVFAAVRKSLSARKLQARIENFNRIAAEKQRLWADIKVRDGLVKPGSKVYWRGSDGSYLSGTARSLITTADNNGTNVLIEDASGNLHVVSSAGVHRNSLDINADNRAATKKHQAKADKEKKSIEKGKVAYSGIGVRGDNHPTVKNNGEVDAIDPATGEFVKTYNAFLKYLEEARDKSNDPITFTFNEKFLNGKLFNPEVANRDELLAAQAAFKKVKAGDPISKEEKDALIDWMPMSMRIQRSDQPGTAGAYLRTKQATEDEQFDRIERPIREKIINTWLLESKALGTKNELEGITGNFAFQYTGDLNVDTELQENGNMITNLKGVTMENLNLFAVGSQESHEIINQNGDRTKVPAELTNKTGGMYITVKDNNGKDFNLRVRNNILEGSAELDVIMMLLEDIMTGAYKMDSMLSNEIATLIEDTMPRFADVFEDNITYGVLYNTLVYQGKEDSQLGVSIEPLTGTFTIGTDVWTKDTFVENMDVIKGMLGLKYKNVNFPSNDLTKNKLVSTKNKKYLSYIIEDKVISTNIKEDAAIFTGKPSESDPNYVAGIQPFISPNEIKGKKKAAPKKSKARKGTVKKDARKLGSRLVQQLRRAGYDPSNLTKQAADFLQSIGKKSGKVFIQAIEDYNNRVMSEEDNSGDHVIKKCKG